MVMDDDPRVFLESQGWPFKQSGAELVLECPFCNKRGHLYMHRETGLWKCHRCGEGGNLYQLRQRLGLSPHGRSGIQSLGQAINAPKRRIPMAQVATMHRALLDDPEGLGYVLEARRWARPVVERMQLGLRVDGRGKWLAFPWLRRGECLGVKYRILPAYQERYPQRFDREPDCESVLYNVDALAEYEEIILASGESDALSLLSVGFPNIVATTTGESSLPATAVDALTKKTRVLVPYDRDDAGQQGVRKVAKRVGFDRIWLVELPAGVKDVNDYLVQGATRNEFEVLFAAAVQFDVPSVYTLAQAFDRLEAEKTIGIWDDVDAMTPWPSVNRRLGMWRGGNLITLSAPQGTGKTTFALNVVAAWAASGRPALMYCLEMGLEELVQHVLCAHYELEEEQITPAVIARARHDLGGWPLYLGSNPRITGRKEVMELLAQAIRRYGLRLLAFDNLHMLGRSIEHRTEEIGALTKSFKLLAMEYEIPLLLIAQPRKLERGRVMTPWDLKDSVDIFSDSDQVILLHRELVGSTREGEAVAAAGTGERDNLSPITLVRLAKARHRASRDGLLFFMGAQHQFREIQSGDLPKTTTAHEEATADSGRGSRRPDPPTEEVNPW
jgi:replicative DNA helicase